MIVNFSKRPQERRVTIREMAAESTSKMNVVAKRHWIEHISRSGDEGKGRVYLAPPSAPQLCTEVGASPAHMPTKGGTEAGGMQEEGRE